MQIQPNNTPNFKATRVLTATQKVRDKAPNILDLFVLNPKNQNDNFFAETCLRKINSRTNNDNNINQLKRLFISFLNHEIYSYSNKNNQYFIAIKNGEEITGGYITNNNGYAFGKYENAIKSYNDNLTLNAKKYNLFEDFLRSNAKYLRNIDDIKFPYGAQKAEVENLKKQILEKEKNTQYEKIENSKQDIDLLKFIGFNRWR